MQEMHAGSPQGTSSRKYDSIAWSDRLRPRFRNRCRCHACICSRSIRDDNWQTATHNMQTATRSVNGEHKRRAAEPFHLMMDPRHSNSYRLSTPMINNNVVCDPNSDLNYQGRHRRFRNNNAQRGRSHPSGHVYLGDVLLHTSQTLHVDMHDPEEEAIYSQLINQCNCSPGWGARCDWLESKGEHTEQTRTFWSALRSKQRRMLLWS